MYTKAFHTFPLIYLLRVSWYSPSFSHSKTGAHTSRQAHRHKQTLTLTSHGFLNCRCPSAASTPVFAQIHTIVWMWLTAQGLNGPSTVKQGAMVIKHMSPCWICVKKKFTRFLKVHKCVLKYISKSIHDFRTQQISGIFIWKSGNPNFLSPHFFTSLPPSSFYVPLVFPQPNTSPGVLGAHSWSVPTFPAVHCPMGRAKFTPIDPVP